MYLLHSKIKNKNLSVFFDLKNQAIFKYKSYEII